MAARAARTTARSPTAAGLRNPECQLPGEAARMSRCRGTELPPVNSAPHVVDRRLHSGDTLDRSAIRACARNPIRTSRRRSSESSSPRRRAGSRAFRPRSPLTEWRRLHRRCTAPARSPPLAVHRDHDLPELLAFLESLERRTRLREGIDAVDRRLETARAQLIDYGLIFGIVSHRRAEN